MSVPSAATGSEATATTITFLGPAGTFTEAALDLFDAQKHSHQRWSGAVTEIPVASPAEALAAVREGRADYACVAIENSVDGVVTATMDALSGSAGEAPVQVFAEVDLPVEFAILSREPENLSTSPLTVTTHPVAYEQVKEWLSTHLSSWEFIPSSSNGAAAQAVSEGVCDIAVAPRRAADVFDLAVLAEGIADHPGAKTRFLLVGQPDAPTACTGNDRTSVTFLAANEPGSLVVCLSEFAQRGVDLTRIESRPTKTELGSYRFFVDMAGHIDDDPVAEALRALYLRCPEMRFLGSWPSAEEAKPVRIHKDRIAEASQWVEDMRAGRRR